MKNEDLDLSINFEENSKTASNSGLRYYTTQSISGYVFEKTLATATVFTFSQQNSSRTGDMDSIFIHPVCDFTPIPFLRPFCSLLIVFVYSYVLPPR